MPTVTVLAWCLIASTGRVSWSNRRGQFLGQTIDDDARGTRFAELDREHIERHEAEHVVAQRHQPRRGAGLQRAVVAAEQQVLAELDPVRLQMAVHAAEHVAFTDAGGERHLDRAAHLAQRQRQLVDRHRRAIAEQVAGHRRQHVGQGRVHRRHVDRRRGGAEASFAGGRDHDRAGLVRLVDRDFLGDVRRRSSPTGRRRRPGSSVPTTGRCASCPRSRRRRSTCSTAR